MSHWTKVKLKITDSEVLAAALKRMGVEQVNVGEKTITQYGQSAKADLWVDDAVGFRREDDGTFAMVGDFYHSNDSKMRGYYNRNEKFIEDLNVAYGVEDTIRKMESLGMGFSLDEEIVDEDGNIRLEFSTLSSF